MKFLIVAFFLVLSVTNLSGKNIEDHKLKRLKRFMSSLDRPNKNYQECITPDGNKGHCKHPQYCLNSDFKTNVGRVLDYICIIERTSIGVCCADDLTETSGSNISISLPTREENQPPTWRVPNKNYQECITPNGSKGHCKHIQHCLKSDFKTNVWRFLDYLCIIERSSIGVCCEDELTERAGSDFSISLPTRGDDDAPIWGVEDDNKIGEEIAAIVNHPEERGCGLATKQFPKITGGRPSDPGEWPWMAAILDNPLENGFCGGVLITDRHVLTAAHCTRKYRASELFVRLGEYNFNTYNETRARDFRVIEKREHVDFDRTTYENDIAILKIHTATIFNSYIWPVCMPPSGETWEGYSAVIIGWGTQFFGGPASNILMEVIVPVWNQNRCESSFAQRIADTFICAGAYEGGRDSCQGDSGGPLLVQLPNKRWVTVGIVSWGVRCGEPNRPGIYTRVSSYTDWVIENSTF